MVDERLVFRSNLSARFHRFQALWVRVCCRYFRVRSASPQRARCAPASRISRYKSEESARNLSLEERVSERSAPSIAEIAAFGLRNVVVHHRARCAALVLGWQQQIIFGGRGRTIMAGEQHGDEGLLEVVAGAFGLDQ